MVAFIVVIISPLSGHTFLVLNLYNCAWQVSFRATLALRRTPQSLAVQTEIQGITRYFGAFASSPRVESEVLAQPSKPWTSALPAHPSSSRHTGLGPALRHTQPPCSSLQHSKSLSGTSLLPNLGSSSLFFSSTQEAAPAHHASFGSFLAPYTSLHHVCYCGIPVLLPFSAPMCFQRVDAWLQLRAGGGSTPTLPVSGQPVTLSKSLNHL